MNRILTATAAAVALLAITAASTDHHIKAELVSAPGSSVHGFVQLTQLPHGGSNLVVVADGLEPGGTYASFYYHSADCSEPADPLGSYTADADGHGGVVKKIDDDLDEVGSVSVRVGPGYGTLLACARVH